MKTVQTTKKAEVALVGIVEPIVAIAKKSCLLTVHANDAEIHKQFHMTKNLV